MTEHHIIDAASRLRRERIAQFLRNELASGPPSVGPIEAKAKVAGLSSDAPFALDKAWRKARAALGIGREHGTVFKNNAWHWSLPVKMPPAPQRDAVDSLPAIMAADAPLGARARVGARKLPIQCGQSGHQRKARSLL